LWIVFYPNGNIDEKNAITIEPPSRQERQAQGREWFKSRIVVVGIADSF
jgi:hypothetical protein